VDEPAAGEALREHRMFNIIDTRSGDKIDFWPLTPDPFDAARFSRRVLASALGISFWVSSPEDTILMKLRWARASGDSPKQYADALRVYEVQTGRLDAPYMRDWAVRLGVSDLLARLEEEAEPV
jgi:hypothetical protein